MAPSKNELEGIKAQKTFSVQLIHKVPRVFKDYNPALIFNQFNMGEFILVHWEDFKILEKIHKERGKVMTYYGYFVKVCEYLQKASTTVL
jgi:hypothetical protein